METNTTLQQWVVGDRSQRDTTKSVSGSIDQLLMADVNFTPVQPNLRIADRSSTQPEHLEMAGLFGSSNDSKVQKLESEAMRYYRSQDPKIFDVRSGPYAGMVVPEALRCAIFQSNLAVKAGLIRPDEVTVRAIEFGNLIQRKGYQRETFVPGKSYPDGTYIVGAGGGTEGDTNHVALVLNGKLLHTRAGRIENEPIASKFRAGAYDQMRVYIPPQRKTT